MVQVKTAKKNDWKLGIWELIKYCAEEGEVPDVSLPSFTPKAPRKEAPPKVPAFIYLVSSVNFCTALHHTILHCTALHSQVQMTSSGLE